MEFGVQTMMDMHNELISAFCPIKIIDLHVFSDSMISLDWLISKVAKYDKIERKGTIVNNRLDSIVKYRDIKPLSCHHIGGINNPADKVTRTVSSTLLNNSNYLDGPALPEKLNPIIIVSKEICSVKCNLVQTPKVAKPIIDVSRYSSFAKACRITNLVTKFLDKKLNCKISEQLSISSDDSQYASRSGLLLVKLSQQISFHSELCYLTSNGRCKEGSILVKQLNLFLDDNGLIRVKGKIKSAGKLKGFKYPYLLAKDSDLTKLIIEDLHYNILKHIGIYKLLSQFRKEFNIPAALQTVKRITRKCIVCLKLNGRTSQVNQNGFRDYRIAPEEIPFRDIALDHIGTFNVKLNGSREKVYILMLTCCWSPAVNLIMCRKIDNESFMLAFQEHIYCYGPPSHILGDNGSPIVSSLKIITDLMNDSEIQQFLAQRGIKFMKFDPYLAHASYLGGIVESLVKQVKHLIYTTVGKNHLYVFQFNLLVKECNMLINKRPVAGDCSTVKLEDPTLQILTPELIVRGYEIPCISVIPHDVDLNDCDPSYCFEETSTTKLYQAFQKLSKCQVKLKEGYYDQFLYDLFHQSLTKKGRYSRKTHVMVEVGDLVAIKCKYSKPYFYPDALALY